MVFTGFNLNYWAILVSAFINMVVGSVWYSPLIFGKSWMKLIGLDKKNLEKAKQKGMGKIYFIAFISSLIIAFVMSMLIMMLGINSFIIGAKLGLLIWLGFIATTFLGVVLWENKSVKLYLINVLYYLVVLLLIGGMLAVWQ